MNEEFNKETEMMQEYGNQQNTNDMNVKEIIGEICH